jgi:steroid delta-isomerase-like uncharacterized protein
MSIEASKELFRQHIDVHWHQGKLAEQDDPILADDYAGHNIIVEVKGLQDYNEFNKGLRTAFPDFHVVIDESVAEGDLAAFRFTCTGTHQGDLMGIPATGKRVEFTGSVFIRVENGKIAESWNFSDWLGMLQQIGVVPTIG